MGQGTIYIDFNGVNEILTCLRFLLHFCIVLERHKKAKNQVSFEVIILANERTELTIVIVPVARFFL